MPIQNESFVLAFFISYKTNFIAIFFVKFTFVNFYNLGLLYIKSGRGTKSRPALATSVVTQLFDLISCTNLFELFLRHVEECRSPDITLLQQFGELPIDAACLRSERLSLGL